MQQHQNNSISVGYGITKVDAAKMRHAAQQRSARVRNSAGFFAGVRSLFK